MVETVINNEELLIINEGIDSLGGQSATKEVGKSRGKKESSQTQDYRKKKQDALEGKESQESRSSEDDSEGKGHGATEDSSDKGGKSEGSGPQSQSSLQSGQTTVQFSSGGAAGNFGSLLALFASSASLVRAESGAFINFSTQTINITLRSLGPVGSNVSGINLSDEINRGENTSITGSQTSESSISKFILDAGSTVITHSTGATQNILSNLLHTITANAGETSGNQSSITPQIIFTVPPPIITSIPTFNVGSLFINNPDVFFAFANSTTPNKGLIDLYIKQVGLTASSPYTYQFFPPQLPTGFTLTPSGDLTVGVSSPASVLVDILGSTILPVRIDVGPGTLLADTSSQTTPFIGNPTGSFTNGTVMRVSGNEEVVGNTIAYNSPNWGTSVPSNVIYRHVFTETNNDITTIKVPSAPVMGNFETGNITIPNQTTPATLTLGGNVLDVFGTQYGIGQSLTLNLNATPTVINFAGNTLAGFGTYYGDFKTLNLNAQAPAPIGVLETINFGPTQIYVDKAVGSIIYPDLQTLNLTGDLHNLDLKLSNSIIQGREGSDTFYGEIANLGDLNNSALYNGFLKGVTTGTSNGQLVTTAADSNNNSITWGNDTYTGKGQATGSTGTVVGDTYHFTLLGDTTGVPTIYGYSQAKPIMLGNDTITDFNPKLDTLDFQVTQALLKSLDTNHDKQVSASELMSAVTPAGTTLNFSAGGSLTLNGVSNFDFSQAHFVTEVNLTYVAIATIPTNQVLITPSTPTNMPISAPPFLYGEGPFTDKGQLLQPYYNELDNFFSNSLLATYSVSGTGITSIADPLITGATEYVVAPGLTINQFGTISAANTTPIFIELTIKGTDQQGGTATTNQFFGFLDAPMTNIDISAIPNASLSNIITGGANSILGGEPTFVKTISISGNQSYGSNLIVGTAGVKAAYGDFITFNLFPSGTGSHTIIDTSSSTGGVISGSTFNFKANAFDITGGPVYGADQTLNITATGGSGDSLTLSAGTTSNLSLIDSGLFNMNHITFGNQTFYGYGTFYGDVQNLNISAIAGNNGTLVVTTIPSSSSSAIVNISGQVDHNVFTFNPVQMTVQGDVSSQTTTLYANVETLSVTTQPSFLKNIGANYTIDASATFSNNSFDIKNATLTGGMGNTIFYANANFDANTSTYAYHGFTNPVSVSTSGGYLVTTTTDGFNNSITWGNDTFTGGQGSNIYNFTLLDNAAGSISADFKSDNYAVFTGYKDTITNFINNSVLRFNLESNLYNQILQAAITATNHGATGLNTTQVTAADLDMVAQFSNPTSSSTLITFNGPINGTLTLGGISIDSFTQLNHLTINQITTTTFTPTVNATASFDPIFVNVSQPGAFAAFISGVNPLNLSYTATGLPSGITLTSDGTLNVNVTGPVDASISVKATYGATTLTIPTVHIFALNDPTGPIFYDSTSASITGTPKTMAFEVTAGTVYGGGADIKLANASLAYGSKLIDDTSPTTTHTIYGVVQNITNDGSVDIIKQTFTFGGNLMNINLGNSTTTPDQIFGDGQNLILATSSSTPHNFSTNVFTFGPDTLYGSGTLYGNFQSIILNNLSPSVSIHANIFSFGENKVTSGVYLNGTDTLTSSTDTVNLFGNVATLAPTGTGVSISQVDHNTFTFGDDILKGGAGATNFYGHLVSFGSSTDTAQYGTNNFYDGVSVAPPSINPITQEKILTIKDGDNNSITWGNDTYTGGTGVNTYHFTIVGTNDTTSKPVMQGFDTITNFNLTSDKLIFSLPNPIYNTLAGGSGTLTPSAFLSDLSITQTSTDAILTFEGGGSIDLVGFGSIKYPDLASLEASLANDIIIGVGDPISAKGTLTSNVMIFGSTADLNTWTNLFNTNHILSATVDGITLNIDGTVNFGTNTGIINASIASVTANDSTNTVTSNGPDHILALNGALIDQIGNEQGNSPTDVYGTGAYVFVDQGNATITGGIIELDYSATSNPGALTYASKLIYDGSGNADTIYSDVQTISFINDGSATGIANTSHQTITIGTNYIQASGTIYANVENINLTSTGSGIAQPGHNTFTFGNATVVGGTGNDTFYGHSVNFGNSDNPDLYGTNGFYSGVTVTGTTTMTVTDGNSNAITWGNDTYTGGGGVNTYNFTIIPDMTNKAVMQGFDTITNFNPTSDRLLFSLAYPIYAALAGSSPLTPTTFINNLTISQTKADATITFSGGGTLTLTGLGKDTISKAALTADLINHTSLSVADPITAKTTLTSNLMIFGNTTDVNTWTSLVNTGHVLGTTFKGITLNGITLNDITLNLDGTVNFGTNTGIIDTTVSSVTASDITNTVTSTGPVHVLALNGALIDQAGNEQGTTTTDVYGTGADVFVGHGNATITGGATEVDYSVTSNPGALTYGSKLIYDGSGNADTIYSDVQTISFINDGSATGIANTSHQTITIGTNYIQASGTIYANVENINLTSTGSGIAQPGHNTFAFGNATIIGGAGNDTFYGHSVNFGNSNNPDLYGTNGFYSGVTVTGTTTMTVTDGNSNAITWGNDTYTGGGGVNTYNFTIIPDMTNKAIMQGFDTISNFNLSSDKLVFNIPYTLYAALDISGTGLTFTEFLPVLSLPTPDTTTVDAVISFNGGGSLTLQGLGQTLTNLGTQLGPDVTFTLADPITAKTTLTSNLMIFGNTADLNTWTNLFNTNHLLSATVDGITLGPTNTPFNFGGITSVIDTTVSSVTASDPYTSVTSTAPVHVLALDGALIDSATGPEQGTTAADVFIGHGNAITGGGADIIYTATGGTADTAANLPYGSKLIYNNAPQGTGTVIGNVQNVNLSVLGTTDDVGAGTTAPLVPNNTVSTNHIDFSPTWIFSNAVSSTYGDVQNISLSATGGTNIFSASASPITDNESINSNVIGTGSNTIAASGNAFGMADSITLNATDGFYSAATGSTEQTSISNNTFQAGGNTLTGNSGSSEVLYGDGNIISMTINSPASSSGTLTEAPDFSAAVVAANTATPGSATVIEGNSLIENNNFTFAANTITGGDMDSSLFAGIDRLVMTNNEQTLNNASQPTPSSIAQDHFTFGDSHLTAGSGTGITEFYGDVNNMSQTNFDHYGVKAQTINGHVQITDTAGTGLFTTNDSTVHDNTITFGNDVMTGSTTGVSVFNTDLLVTTSGDGVAEGNTTINNFGTVGSSNENILDLHLSKALYSDVSNANGGSALITGAMLDNYFTGTGHEAITNSGSNTTISFTDAAHNNLGSLILNGTQFTSFAGLGSNLEITANGTNYFFAAVPGDTISSFTTAQNLNLINFSGDLNLNLSNTLFNSLGLKDTNTDAQNAQKLLDDASTLKGGIAASTSGPNTVLTFESTQGANTTTYGNITLHSATFTATEPLVNHLVVTHH